MSHAGVGGKSDRDGAAVNVDLGPDDVGGSPRGQEQDGVGYLIDLARPTYRDHLHPVRAHRGPVVRPEVRIGGMMPDAPSCIEPRPLRAAPRPPCMKRPRRQYLSSATSSRL